MRHRQAEASPPSTESLGTPTGVGEGVGERSTSVGRILARRGASFAARSADGVWCRPRAGATPQPVAQPRSRPYFTLIFGGFGASGPFLIGDISGGNPLSRRQSSKPSDTRFKNTQPTA